MKDEEYILKLLGNERYRAILSVLNDSSHPLSLSGLAQKLAAHDGACFEEFASEQDPTKLVIVLHHQYLPRLDDAALINYDPVEKLVTAPETSPGDWDWADPHWLANAFDGASGETTGSAPIRVLEEQADIYEYGRRLADEADSELFLIYTSTELLDTDCVPCARRAIERDVDFHVGTQNPAVSAFFAEHLPEAELWVPQWDWTNDRLSYPRVERLIFADRERLVIGITDEQLDGTVSETAMVGEGERNPLVVFVRDLLGARLDHLDYQSEHFLRNLPFDVE